jgi:RNA polymerase sigma-70 factor (ECF subfamily)
MHDDEAARIEGWRRGDEAAVRAVFDVYYPRAVRIAALSGLPDDLAQDCAQEAFVHAFQRRAQLRDPKAFPLWFHRIVTRHILDVLSARKPSREVPLEDAGELAEDWQRRQAPQPEDVALLAERREALWRRVQALPPGYRVPLVLRYYGNFSLREVAELMEARDGTMRVTIHRALSQLRQSASKEPILAEASVTG